MIGRKSIENQLLREIPKDWQRLNSRTLTLRMYAYWFKRSKPLFACWPIKKTLCGSEMDQGRLNWTTVRNFWPVKKYQRGGGVNV